MVINYVIPDQPREKRFKCIEWYCSIPLNCFPILKRDYTHLQEAGIVTVEDLNDKDRLKSALKNRKEGFRIENFVEELFRHLSTVKKEHLHPMATLRKKNCRYTKDELSAIAMFRILRPFIKKHKQSEAMRKLPETILTNPIKMQALLAA